MKKVQKAYTSFFKVHERACNFKVENVIFASTKNISRSS